MIPVGGGLFFFPVSPRRRALFLSGKPPPFIFPWDRYDNLIVFSKIPKTEILVFYSLNSLFCKTEFTFTEA